MKVIKTASYKKLAKLDLSNLFTGEGQEEKPPIQVPENYQDNLQALEDDKNFDPYKNEGARWTEEPEWSNVEIDWRRQPSPEEEAAKNNLKAEGYKIHDWMDGVSVITLWDWMQKNYPNDEIRSLYQEIEEKVEAWGATNNATFYAAPRELFSVHDAVRQAKHEGKTIAIVDDLS